ncbi:MAG TPA: T9SS type A sorting domain-containing protein [Chitinophagales bacterium]|nr:T9SS type A sorting domain-containing protein [Chitinophagales bacterium]
MNALSAKAQIGVDSARIVQLNDTSFGLALYDVLLPSGPCVIIDSSKQVENDSIKISLCYLYGNALSIVCHAYDTILLGNLTNASYTIIVALARTDTFNNTCASPHSKDTLVLYYTPTNIEDVTYNNSATLFTNPVSNKLSGKVNSITSKAHLQVMTLEGRIAMPDVTITQPNFEIDVSSLPAGMYLLQALDDKQRWVKKFVKE